MTFECAKVVIESQSGDTGACYTERDKMHGETKQCQ